MALPIRSDVLGPRLKAARATANLTQEQAAKALGLARTTLLAIESGKRPVRPEEIRAFSALYKVREGELLSGARQPLDLEVKFRSSGQSATPSGDSAKDDASRLLNRLAAAAIEFEELLGHPVIKGDYPIWHLSSDVGIEDQAEDAALMFRQRLGVGLGPLPDLKPLLELEFGIRIFERPLNPSVSGACSFDKNYGAFMLLNINHWHERRQLTAGHEIGHGMVRPGEPAVILSSETYLDREDRFCDAFARALLMPAVAVRRKAGEIKGSEGLTVRHVLWLAAYFRVSIEAMGRRMESLGLLPKGTYESLKRSGLGRKHLEQVAAESRFDLTPIGFTPRLFFMAGEAYLRGLLSEQQIAEKLELDLPTVRKALAALVPQSDREPSQA
jgi:Zn-dependent peptidase ImmA (M78 family)/transcriptional regulator with XRE-family HTH domain